MRFSVLLLLVLAALSVVSRPVMAASQQDWRQCKENIAACDRILSNRTETAQSRAAAYSSRCRSWYVKGNSDHALSDCNEALRLDPKLALAYIGRGEAYRAKGDNDRAIADNNEALRLDPKYAALAYRSRGAAYQAKGDNDLAIADYSEAVRLDPKYVIQQFSF